MDQMRTTQAAKYLGVHRSTLNRLSTGVLPPDGYSGSNRPYWLKATLDRHRLGMLKVGAHAYVSCELLPELSVGLSPRQLVLGHSTVPIPTDGASRAACFSSVMTYLASQAPMGMLLPAAFVAHLMHQATVDICRSVGATVILIP